MSTTREGEEHNRESQEARLQRVESSNIAGIEMMLSKLVDSLAHNQRQMLEAQAQSQQHLLESLTTNFNKGLEEVLKHQNKALANPTGDKKVKADEKKQKTAENAVVPYVVEEYATLFSAAYWGDWDDAKEYFETHPDSITKKITSDSETALHVAVKFKEWNFVEEIVKFISVDDLEAKEKSGFTALHMAAAHGNIKAAESMVNKNRKLIMLLDNDGNIPLETAISNVSDGQDKTVKYLYIATLKNYPSLFSGPQGAKLLCCTIEAGYFDVAISIVERFPDLTMEKIDKRDLYALESVVCRPFSFLSGTKLPWWQRFIYLFIRVNLCSPYDNLDSEEDKENPLENLESTIRADDEENHLESSEGPINRDEDSHLESYQVPIRDEENPLDSSDGQIVDEENPLDGSDSKIGNEEDENDETDKLSLVSTESKKGLIKFISERIMPSYLARVPFVKRLYNKKLMHKQAILLVKKMLEQIDDKTTTVAEVIEFLNKTSVVNMAIKNGITEFIKECLDIFPFVISHDLRGESMIQIAIAERNEEILNLLLEAGKDQRDDLLCKVDESGNSILHYVAKIAPSYHLNTISGAALQMQRETQWYKGIESMVHPFLKHMRNVNGDTAQFVFTEEHKKLVATGEKWMKETSGSCMVVATLIATVAFAAAFTLPGGNISELESPKNGFPVFLRKNTFAMFALADAVALFSSITSVIMFLAIMTSRYSEEDFLVSLPQKLILGLANLFLSMASILVAFGAALFLALRDRYAWTPIPIAIFGLISMFLFALEEFPLFFQMVRVTYWPRVLKSKNRRSTSSDKVNRLTIKQNSIKQKAKKDN
ncbi:hypothetical protein C5167_026640 [Papaver somniferum]|uniref:uncharacterized protein LOC113326049 n=1 Tax=Papaver somniferum TaxID=3469 RepID=UPI000E6FAE8C|nr:uncharacterized protein LOC113326049 [Papaver somniferum]RZC85973.1 hypothetical protein C5167_026640 [Papaver somniferum]